MIKPKIVLSRCFCEAVRYNGGIVNDEFVEKLKSFVDFITVCPEVEIRLGVPRKRIIIVEDMNSKKLIQPETGLDFTKQMIEFTEKKIASLSSIDGFILKAKSPSCGVGSTKIYRNGSVIGKTHGFFAEGIKRAFLNLPLEDEGRLRDEGIRKHFLTRIFAFAEFREFFENPTHRALVNFHSKYKYLLMTYSQKHLKELGKIVADGKIPFEEKFLRYKAIFYDAFLRKPSEKKHVNTLLHIMGHFSKKLNQMEKRHLLDLIEKFKNGKVQLNVITELLKSLSYRFENEYILLQKYLSPYPDELN